MNTENVKVGIVEKDYCYIGTLDQSHEVPCADELKGKLCYVDLPNGRFLVAFVSELIYRQ